MRHAIATYCSDEVRTVSLAGPTRETLPAVRTAAALIGLPGEAFSVEAHIENAPDGTRLRNTYLVYVSCGSVEYRVLRIDGHPTTGAVTRYDEDRWPAYVAAYHDFAAWRAGRPARIAARKQRLFAAAKARAAKAADKAQAEIDARTNEEWDSLLLQKNESIRRENARQDERAAYLRRRMAHGDEYAARALSTCTHSPEITMEQFRAQEADRVARIRHDCGVPSEMIEAAETELDDDYEVPEMIGGAA